MNMSASNVQTITSKRDPTVYECWVSNNRDSFIRLSSKAEVSKWVDTVLPMLPLFGHINIVSHKQSEYAG